jgi:hypothetical protein
LHRFDDWCVARFACGWFNALLDSNYPAATHEAKRQLGPGGSLHQEIWDKGDGRYSVWSGVVYFSLPHDVPSIINVKRLELRVPIVSWLAEDKLARFFSWFRYLSALGLLAWAIIAIAGPRLEFFYRNILPGTVISAGLIALVLVAAELYFRNTERFPVSENKYPIHYVDQVGMMLIPKATVKWTNGIDFWVTEKVNSLGFLDREPALPKPSGRYRILLVGDSFVEALQVPIAQKLQTVLLAGLQQKFPGKDFDTVALGYSGTGQSSQLRYYERNRTEFKPDLVVLLFVNNDFVDNSRVLEGIRQGWHPDHPPWLFMQAGSTCERLPIASDWQKFLISGASDSARARQLRAMSRDIDISLGNWDPDADNIDRMFYKEKETLPPAFDEAIASTRCAFGEWKKLAEQDGFRLIVVAVDGVVANGTGLMARLKPMLEGLDLPLLDLYPVFYANQNPDAAHWKMDPHWSPTGHRWAADAILNYLMTHGYIKQH